MRIFFSISFLFLFSISMGNTIDSLKKVLKDKKLDDVSRVQMLKDLSFEYVYVSPDTGIMIARKIYPIAKRNNDLSMKAKADVVMATNFYIKQEYDSAILYYENAIAYGEKKADNNILSPAYNNLGLLYLDISKLKKSLEYLQKALDIRIKQDNKKAICETYDNIGLVYSAVSDFPTAIEYHFKALKIADELNDEALISYCYNNIATAFGSNENLEKSLEYYFKSYHHISDTTNHYEMAYTLSNISFTLNLLNKSVASYKYMKRALKHVRHLQGELPLSTAYNNLGLTFFNSNDSLIQFLNSTKSQLTDSALFYFNKSLEDSHSQYNYRQKANIHLNLTNLYLVRKNNPVQAKYHALECLKNSELARAEDIRLKALYDLAMVSQKLGDFSNATKYLIDYIYLRDKIFTENKNNELISGELKYEFNKKQISDSLNRLKEKQIDEDRIKQQNITIAEKEKRMYILYGGLFIVVLFSIFLFNRIQLINKQKKTIEEQKHIVEEKQKEITDSINYAKRIQYSLLAHENILKENLNDFFILFQPKDIVSGDFYWCTKKGNDFYLAICDCTGHGVPGAFMSLLNISFLNEAITEKSITEPHLILNHVRKRLIENMEGSQDGMDAILVKFSGEKIQYAAAHNRPVMIKNNSIEELTADKMPVGKGENDTSFTLFEIPVQKGNMLYFYTDGYADQFGGPKGKKFKYSNLQKLLLQNSSEKTEIQKTKLESVFSDWKENLEQVDDVCIIGIKL